MCSFNYHLVILWMYWLRKCNKGWFLNCRFLIGSWTLNFENLESRNSGNQFENLSKRKKRKRKKDEKVSKTKSSKNSASSQKFRETLWRHEKKTSFSFCKKNKVLNKVLCKQTVNNMLNICSWTDNNSNKKPTQKSAHFQELLEHCNDCINSMLAELKKTHQFISQNRLQFELLENQHQLKNRLSS